MNHPLTFAQRPAIGTTRLEDIESVMLAYQRQDTRDDSYFELHRHSLLAPLEFEQDIVEPNLERITTPVRPHDILHDMTGYWKVYRLRGSYAVLERCDREGRPAGAFKTVRLDSIKSDAYMRVREDLPCWEEGKCVDWVNVVTWAVIGIACTVWAGALWKLLNLWVG